MVTSEEKVLREAVRKYWENNNSFSKNNYKDIKAFLEKEYIGKNISNPKLQKPFLWIVSFGLGEKITASSGKDKKTYDETLDSILKAITLSRDFSVNRYAYTIVQTLTYAINRYDCKEKYVYIDILSELKEKEENEEKVNDLDSLRQKNTVLIQENKDLSTENEKLKKEISEKEKLIRELEDEDETYKRAVRDNLVNQNKISHEDHISEINDKNDEIKKYKNRIEQLSNQIQDYQEERKEFLSERVLIKNKLHDIQEKNEKLLKENSEIRKQLSKAEEENKIIKNEYDIKMVQIKGYIKKLNSKIEIKENEIEKYKKNIKQYEVDKNNSVNAFNYETVKSVNYRVQRSNSYVDYKKPVKEQNSRISFCSKPFICEFNEVSANLTKVSNPISVIDNYIMKNGFTRYACSNIDEVVRNSKAIIKLTNDNEGSFIGREISGLCILLLNPRTSYNSTWLSMHKFLFNIRKNGDQFMRIIEPAVLNSDFTIKFKGEIELYN